MRGPPASRRGAALLQRFARPALLVDGIQREIQRLPRFARQGFRSDGVREHRGDGAVGRIDPRPQASLSSSCSWHTVTPSFHVREGLTGRNSINVPASARQSGSSQSFFSTRYRAKVQRRPRPCDLVGVSWSSKKLRKTAIHRRRRLRNLTMLDPLPEQLARERENS